MKKIIKTIIVLLIAVNLCGLGVGLFVQAGLGSDSLTLLQEGMSIYFNISLGASARIFVIVSILLGLLISRKDIGWVTIAYGLIVSYPIDYFNQLFMNLNIAQMSLLIRIICIILGQLSFILTFSLLIKVRNGMNQIDAIAYGIVRFTKIDYKIIRTGIDVLFIIIGVILGGTFGIGSILTMLTTGIGIDTCLKIMDKKRR